MAKKIEREPGFVDDIRRAIEATGKTPQEIIHDATPQVKALVAGHNGRLYPTVDTPLSQCPSNIDPMTRHGKAMLMASGNPGDLDFVDGVAEVTATHWLVFPDEGVDPETGEIGTFARTVLFTADGRTFRTTSGHAPHRIAAACDLYTAEEWAAGVTFIIRERRSRKTGHTYHDIRTKE